MKIVKFILVAALFVSGISSPILSYAARVERHAEITSMEGNVTWRKSGTENWQAADPNQKLGGGDALQTGDLSSATLTFDEGSVILLGANSEFVVQSLAKETTTGDLESLLAILKGTVTADVTHLEGASVFEIQTPVNYVSVKGTALTLTLNADGSVSASTETGAVDVVGEGLNSYSIDLGEGKEGLVNVDPVTGDVTITAVAGGFDVIGPDGNLVTLAEGDSLVISGGAATFIPNLANINSPSAGSAFGEPPSGG